jgi:hypothetical protein
MNSESINEIYNHFIHECSETNEASNNFDEGPSRLRSELSAHAIGASTGASAYQEHADSVRRPRSHSLAVVHNHAVRRGGTVVPSDGSTAVPSGGERRRRTEPRQRWHSTELCGTVPPNSLAPYRALWQLSSVAPPATVTSTNCISSVVMGLPADRPDRKPTVAGCNRDGPVARCQTGNDRHRWQLNPERE